MNLCSLCRSIKDLKKDEINILELYSGLGGFHYSLLDCGLSSFDIRLNVTAIDINSNANNVYKYNFKDCNKTTSKVLSKNLSSISINEIDDLNIDICTISPPCQPFTRQHQNQQFEQSDHRTESFNHLITNIFPNLINKPKYFIIENVRNFEQSITAKQLLMMFEKMNYNYQQFLLQPFQFGLPNSRYLFKKFY